MKGKSTHEIEGIEMLDGVLRRTLSYNEEVMLCHFQLAEGASIPLHNHRASQIGFMVKGAVRFLGEQETDSFVARAGRLLRPRPPSDPRCRGSGSFRIRRGLLPRTGRIQG